MNLKSKQVRIIMLSLGILLICGIGLIYTYSKIIEKPKIILSYNEYQQLGFKNVGKIVPSCTNNKLQKVNVYSSETKGKDNFYFFTVHKKILGIYKKSDKNSIMSITYSPQKDLYYNGAAIKLILHYKENNDKDAVLIIYANETSILENQGKIKVYNKNMTNKKSKKILKDNGYKSFNDFLVQEFSLFNK